MTVTSILFVPNIGGFSTTNCTNPSANTCSTSNWSFSGPSTANAQTGAARWTYSFVPEPGSLALLGLGLSVALRRVSARRRS